MSGVRYGIGTNAITWEASESEIKVSNTGGVDITIVGSVGVGAGVTSLESAMALIPKQVPMSPLGNSTLYSGAILLDYSSRYLGDDTIQVSATYGYADPLELQPGGDELKDASESDRAVRTIAVEEVPLLAHPVAQNFPVKEKMRLAALLAGTVEINALYDPAGSGKEAWLFKKRTDDGEEFEEVIFDSADVTADGVTASPLDYAKLIASGITVYRRPLVRHSVTRQRNAPVGNNVYTQVGEALTYTPVLAPSLSGGQWFLNGVTDSTANGELWTAQLEFEYTAQGGALKAIYKGGTAEIV